MTRSVSIWLDILRVVATLLVVVSHLAYPRFTGASYAYLRDWNLGSDSVIVFFVISGCVIAYAADRDGSGARFAFNRTTRLMTVMLPALLLTIIFDAIGTRVDMSAYPQSAYRDLPPHEILLRGLTFTNQWEYFDRLRLGSNGALWSLSYEATYYVMFSMVMFLKSWAWLAGLLAISFFAGPNIILLLPTWLMGVGLWYWLKAERQLHYGRITGWGLTLAGPLAYVICQMAGLPAILLMQTTEALGVPDARSVIGFSNEYMWNWLIGIFTLLHIAGVAILNPQRLPFVGAVRWLAAASFSIYVTHYPALHLLDALLPEMLGRDALMLTGCLVVGLLFASVFERPIRLFRDRLEQLAPRLRRNPSGDPSRHPA